MNKTPCVARPSTGFFHIGACQCFFGGQAPEFAPVDNPAAA